MGIEDDGVARHEDIEEKLVRSRSFVKIFSFLSKIRRNTNFVRLIFLMLLKKKVFYTHTSIIKIWINCITLEKH